LDVTEAGYLRVDVFGIDLSPAMIALARLRYPGLRFEVGSMSGLDIPDGSLGGVLASSSIIHLPWERRADVFSEFHRVLAPGGTHDREKFSRSQPGKLFTIMSSCGAE
jgi:SAM-dependent methyltransferase